MVVDLPSNELLEKVRCSVVHCRKITALFYPAEELDFLVQAFLVTVVVELLLLLWLLLFLFVVFVVEPIAGVLIVGAVARVA